MKPLCGGMISQSYLLPLPHNLDVVTGSYRILDEGLFHTLIIPKLLNEPHQGSTAPSLPARTLRTTAQTSPTVIKRLRLWTELRAYE